MSVIVYLALFLLLFSALSIAVLYIGQSAQQNTWTQGKIDINELIKSELSGNNLKIEPATEQKTEESGSAIVLPK